MIFIFFKSGRKMSQLDETDLEMLHPSNWSVYRGAIERLENESMGYEDKESKWFNEEPYSDDEDYELYERILKDRRRLENVNSNAINTVLGWEGRIANLVDRDRLPVTLKKRARVEKIDIPYKEIKTVPYIPDVRSRRIKENIDYNYEKIDSRAYMEDMRNKESYRLLKVGWNNVENDILKWKYRKAIKDNVIKKILFDKPKGIYINNSDIKNWMATEDEIAKLLQGTKFYNRKQLERYLNK